MKMHKIIAVTTFLAQIRASIYLPKSRLSYRNKMHSAWSLFSTAELLIEYLLMQSGSCNLTVFSEPKELSCVTIFSIKMPIFTKVKIPGKSIVGFQKFFEFWILYTQILYFSVEFWMMADFLFIFRISHSEEDRKLIILLINSQSISE